MGAARRDPPVKRRARHQQDRLRPAALGKVGGLCSETSHDGYKYSLRTSPPPIGTANEASDIACDLYLPNPNRKRTATRPAPEHWLTAPSGGGSPVD
jgi:hypothetical protein